MQSSARQRLGGPVAGRHDVRRPTVEYVNRLGERVSPVTGKPFNKASSSSTNGLITNTRKSAKRRRRLAVRREGSMFGNLAVIPTDATRDPPPRACFNCWQHGHSRRECPRPLTAHYCNNCGRRGEDLKTCPRCSRAYTEYLLRLQARKRGEEVEPEEVFDELLPGEEYENDDAYDDLIYQDDPARKLRRTSSNYSQEGYKYVSDSQERRHSEQSPYCDKGEEEHTQGQREYNTFDNYYGRRLDNEERDSRSNSRQRDREYTESYSHQDQERSSEYYKDNTEREEDIYYRGGDREREYEARASRSENRQERRKTTNTFDDVDLDTDPVQEVLQLAKSIAHLTPDTQDLIMRQVMAERKELVRLRAIKIQERQTNDWA